MAVALKNGVEADLAGKVCGLSNALARQYLDTYAEALANEATAKNLTEWVRRVESAPKKGAQHWHPSVDAVLFYFQESPIFGSVLPLPGSHLYKP